MFNCIWQKWVCIVNNETISEGLLLFLVHLLHVMDWNATLMFPVAPMFTVILSLVGKILLLSFTRILMFFIYQ